MSPAHRTASAPGASTGRQPRPESRGGDRKTREASCGRRLSRRRERQVARTLLIMHRIAPRLRASRGSAHASHRHAGRLHRAHAADARRRGAGRRRVGPRDQIRRLPDRARDRRQDRPAPSPATATTGPRSMAPVVASARALRCRSAILDGEMCVQNDGRRDRLRGACAVAIKSAPERLVLFAFDLLMLNGRDLRGEPLRRSPAPAAGPGRRRSGSVPHPLQPRARRARARRSSGRPMRTGLRGSSRSAPTAATSAAGRRPG